MPITAQQRASRYCNLYTTSKRLAWDPAAIDLTADKAQWAMITRGFTRQRYDRQIHRPCSLFYQGEESVTETLSPFLGAMNRLALGVDQKGTPSSMVDLGPLATDD